MMLFPISVGTGGHAAASIGLLVNPGEELLMRDENPPSYPERREGALVAKVAHRSFANTKRNRRFSHVDRGPWDASRALVCDRTRFQSVRERKRLGLWLARYFVSGWHRLAPLAGLKSSPIGIRLDMGSSAKVADFPPLMLIVRRSLNFKITGSRATTALRQGFATSSSPRGRDQFACLRPYLPSLMGPW